MSGKEKIDTKHCYMWDVYTQIINDEMENLDTYRKNRVYKNTKFFMQNAQDRHLLFKYCDPDEMSRKLYEDEYNLFFGNRGLENIENIGCEIEIEKDGKKWRLGSDYIGPSTTSAFIAGIDDEKTWEYILRCRTIGGHILWPRKGIENSINIKKANSGAKGIGISDRMDVALYEIKNYLDSKNGKNTKKDEKEIINERLANILEVNYEWFEIIKEFAEYIFKKSYKSIFEAFCDFFYLKGSFVDDNYNIIWFNDKINNKVEKDKKITAKDLNINIVENPEFMIEFMENNAKAIDKRNKNIANA